MAVLTATRKPDENLDDFVHRVLSVDKEQEAEAKAAADKGSEIHKAINECINGREFDPAWKPYVEAVLPVIASLGKIAWSEKVLVNQEAGYAVRGDICLETDLHLCLLDFKTAKTIPKKEPWIEAKLQTASYAKCLGNTADKHIITGVLYISTVMPGHTELFLSDAWEEAYEQGFKPLLQFWQYANGYRTGGVV